MRRYIPAEILAQFGSDYVRETGDEIVYICPYCKKRRGTPDKRGHLYVNTKSLVYFCQRCEAKGYLGYSKERNNHKIEEPPVTDRELMNKIGVLINRTDNLSGLFSLSDSRPLVSNDNSIYVSRAIGYLLQRGISTKAMQFYDMRLGKPYTRCHNRIVVPNELKGVDGELYTDMYVARWFGEATTYDDGKPIQKYLNPKGANRANVVFNLHRIPRESPIIITEGVFTAISAGSNAVATYGKYVSDKQISKILSRNPSIIYVALDPDAIKEAENLCSTLYSLTSSPIRLVRLPEGEDANSLGHKAFMEFVKESEVYEPVAFGLRKLIEKVG